QLLRDAMTRHDEQAVAVTLDELDTGIKESYSDVRELLLHFRVRTHAEDLEPALQETLSKFEHQTGLISHLSILGQGLPLPADVQIQVLHIVQEALSNVRKHAQAQQVWVEVQTAPAWAITVRDDGKGFDTASGPPDDTHVGMRIMRERASRIGAAVSVQSGAGGTMIELKLPATSSLTKNSTPIETN
ncbi:MAG: histidine kinase, partial [Burkholderiales bacterium]|nr:histidine kinase [Burkholderiales bacterium]